ncbi:hypothetical protein GCG54_00015619 [Colletotrichum gloeosporioides]|uniref:Lactonase n=1 Tax=Colletotrichum gloeosporioides TaxID=474922 RepID=A0A8H4C9U0_COLGL|nr:uncharacterized protein GCG54_00015619 [Colletotrichum gloeosporioides]KAF3800036.1 hypothetical protein GCG54_00015619 [Colletotrichum gloeosporioides]
MWPPTFFVSAAAVFLWSGGAVYGQELPHVGHIDFQGRFLVAISDADMVSSAYTDGQIGPPQGSDTLSIIQITDNPETWKVSNVSVGNAVVGPPTAMTVTPNGRYAIVVETLGPRSSANPNTTMSELPSSRKITVIDLIDLDRPAVVDTVEGFLQPSTVSVNAAGDLVAVTHTLAGSGVETPVALYQFQQGKLSLLSTPAIPDWPSGNLLMDAAFHPELDILALTDYSQPRLTLVRVIRQGSETKLERWGNSLSLETAPYTAKFTPDGRYVLSNAMYVGPDIEAPRGTISSIRLEASQEQNGDPHHSIVSRAEVGVMPEGLAVSPDGLWAVTANLERSTPALDSPSQGFFSSLSLLRVEPANGTLSTVGTYAFDGILPEGVVFDSSSRFVASTTFDQYDGRIPGGSIDMWRISGDHADPTRVEFVKTSVSVPVVRGPHVIAMVG